MVNREHMTVIPLCVPRDVTRREGPLEINIQGMETSGLKLSSGTGVLAIIRTCKNLLCWEECQVLENVFTVLIFCSGFLSQCSWLDLFKKTKKQVF